MIKPENYDKTPVSGEYEAPLKGGHHMIIKQVNEMTNKSGNPMIVVLLDFAQNDRQPGLFMREFKNDIRPEKKWSMAGTMYINVTDLDGNTSRRYKTFCSCFEKSNDTQIKWVEDPLTWCAQFKNKKIGGAYGVVHEVYNGEEKIRTKLRWFVSDQKVDPDNIPNEKFLSPEEEKLLGGKNAGDTGFMNIPDGVEDEGLPFN